MYSKYPNPTKRKASVDKYHATHKEEERRKNRERARKYRSGELIPKSQTGNNTLSEYYKKYRASEKGQYVQRKHKLKKFGITPEQYNLLLKAQGGVCGICKRPPTTKRLHTDHDWLTGKVRGLLCGWCNPRMGRDDSILTWLRCAEIYIEQYKQGRTEHILNGGDYIRVELSDEMAPAG